jgi:hypothetical protein
MNKDKFCNSNETVNQTMEKAYNIARRIHPEQNARMYIKQIFDSYNREIALEGNFLDDVECILSHNLFKKIIQDSGLFVDNGNINIQEIQDNDILFITCPSLLAPYHYITAVVSQDRNNVDIYQSFGSSVKLHKITLPFLQFVDYLNTMTAYKNPQTTYPVDIMRVLNVEDKLYGIDVKQYLSEQERYEAVDFEDIRTEEEQEEDEALHFTPYEGFEIREDYERNIRPDVFSINVYRLNQNAGRIRKTKKNRKNKITKKRHKITKHHNKKEKTIKKRKQ